MNVEGSDFLQGGSPQPTPPLKIRCAQWTVDGQANVEVKRSKELSSKA